jgi:hypothetical protein
MSERRQPPQTEIDWQNLLETAVNSPGQLGNSYSRFYNYSFLNLMYLLQQGTPIEPIATYKRWGDLGRHVKKGAKAKEIIRPIQIKLKDELDDKGQPKTITKFKGVRCIFPLSDTEGDDLPPFEPPEWSEKRALGALSINRVLFESLDGNVAGYSINRNVAVNPVAPYPFKTLMHEMGHVVLGHTTPDALKDYQAHRGLKEFEAEGTAYLAMHELDLDAQMNASESRAYIQHWLRGETPPDSSIKSVFKTTDTILKAGRPEVVAELSTAS